MSASCCLVLLMLLTIVWSPHLGSPVLSPRGGYCLLGGAENAPKTVPTDRAQGQPRSLQCERNWLRAVGLQDGSGRHRLILCDQRPCSLATLIRPPRPVRLGEDTLWRADWSADDYTIRALETDEIDRLAPLIGHWFSLPSHTQFYGGPRPERGESFILLSSCDRFPPHQIGIRSHERITPVAPDSLLTLLAVLKRLELDGVVE